MSLENVRVRMPGRPRGRVRICLPPVAPASSARASLKWTNERRLSAQIAANYVGPAWTSFAVRLESYAVVNAGIQWEPFDKAVEIKLDLFNLLDTRFRTSDIGVGPGRAVSGSVLVRF